MTRWVRCCWGEEAIWTEGMPHNPKPPTAQVASSGMSATAARANSAALSIPVTAFRALAGVDSARGEE